MAQRRWNEVITDFGDEETENFGRRVEFGAANNLYQLQTAAVISSSIGPDCKMGFSCPTLLGSSNQTYLAISIERDVKLFTVDPYAYLTALEFASSISCLALFEETDLLIIGLGNGDIVFFSIEEKRRVFSTNVERDSKSAVLKQVVFSKPSKTKGDLITATLFAITDDCRVHVLNLPAALVENQSFNKDQQKRILQGMSWRHFNLNPYHTCASSLLPLLGNADVCVIGNGEFMMTRWTPFMEVYKCNDSLLSSSSQNMPSWRLVKSTCCGFYLMCLDTEGNFHLWDTFTTIFVRKWPQHLFGTSIVEDFYLLETDQTSTDLRGVRILLLSKERDFESSTESRCSVEIRNLLDFSPIYSVVVSDHSKLISCTASQDTIFVAEVVAEEGESANPYIRLRTITEAQLEVRFTRLLARGKFQEAEELALQFGLDVELVYKTEANAIMSSSHADQNCEEILAELIHCLDKMSDISAVSCCCSHAVFPTFEATAGILEYGKQRLLAFHKTALPRDVEAVNAFELLDKITTTVYRLMTFKLCFGHEAFTVSSWSKFSDARTLDSLKRFLSNGQMNDVSTFWGRHEWQIVLELLESDNAIKSLLDSIPDAVTSEALLPWFESLFLPCIFRVTPNSVDIVAAWIEQRTRNMELIEKATWPQCALHFSETLLRVSRRIQEGKFCETPKQIAELTYNISKMNVDSENPLRHVGALNKLVEQLNALVRIHTVYSCRLSFSSFCQETSESLCYRILDRVQALELIPSAIERYAKPYMLEHKLDSTQMLYNYVLDILQQASRWTGYSGASIWEDRAIAVIACIPSLSLRLKGVLEVIKVAHVPWSNAILNLVDDAKKHTDPIVSEIDHQCKVADLKMLLTKYDARMLNTSSLLDARRLCRYILCRNTDNNSELVADAMKISEPYHFSTLTDTLLLRCIWLVEHRPDREGASESIELLKTVDSESAQISMTRFVNYTRIYVETSRDCDVRQRFFCAVPLFRRALRRLQSVNDTRFTCASNDEIVEAETVMKHLDDLYELQKDFAEVVLYPDFMSASFRESLFEKYFEKYNTSSDANCEVANPESRPRFTNLSKTFTNLSFALTTVNGDFLGMETTCAMKPLLNSTTMNNNCTIVSDKNLLRSTTLNTELQITWPRLLKLARLLKIPKANLLTKLVGVASDNVEITRAIQLLQEQLAGTDEELSLNSTTLFGLVFEKLGQKFDLGRNQEPINYLHFTTMICDAISTTLSTCHEDSLQFLLKLRMWAWFASAVCKECEVSFLNFQASDNSCSSMASAVCLPDTVFSGQYKEVGLVMSSAKVMPLVFSLGYHLIFGTGQFRSTLECLVKELSANGRYQFALFAVLFSVFCGCFSENSDESLVLVPFLSKIVAALVNNILISSSGDATLALGYLLLMNDDHDKAITFLQRFRKNQIGIKYKQLRTLARVCEAFSLLHGRKDVATYAQKQYMYANWGYRLAKFNISFKDVLQSSCSKTAVQKVLCELVKLPYATACSLMKEYCTDHHVDPIDAFFSFFEQLVLKSNDLSNVDSVCAHLRQARCVLGHLPKRAFQLFGNDRLNALLGQIDPYNYEAFELVLKLIERYGFSIETANASHMLELLDLLKQYTRSRQPNSAERSSYSKFKAATTTVASSSALSIESVFCEVGSSNFDLPTISSCRLPFRAFFGREPRPWEEVIKHELNLSTVNFWLSCSKTGILQVDETQILEQVVSSYLADQRLPGRETLINPSEATPALQNICELLLHFSEKEVALNLALKIIKDLSSSVLGPQKLMVVRTCVSLSRQVYESLQTQERSDQELRHAMDQLDGFLKVEKAFTCEEILRCHGLSAVCDLKLTRSVDYAKLIAHLYESLTPEDLDMTVQKNRDNWKNLCSAVVECATATGENLRDLHVNLVLRHLSPNSEAADSEDQEVTMNLSMALQTSRAVVSCSSEESGNFFMETESLKRSILILKQMDDGPEFLLSLLQENNPRVSNTFRVRALKALFAVCPIERLETISARNAEELRDYMMHLLYITRLDACRISHTVSTFSAANKEALLLGLWKKAKDPALVQLLTWLCVDYKIVLAQVCGDLLASLVQQNKDKLCDVMLQHIHSHASLWNSEKLYVLWTKCVERKISSCSDVTNVEEKLRKIFDFFILYLQCPVTDSNMAMEVAERAHSALGSQVLRALLKYNFSEEFKTSAHKIGRNCLKDDALFGNTFAFNYFPLCSRVFH